MGTHAVIEGAGIALAAPVKATEANLLVNPPEEEPEVGPFLYAEPAENLGGSKTARVQPASVSSGKFLVQN